jgi:hypothetical protein
MGGRKSRRSSDVELRRSGDEGRGGGESRGGRGGRTEGEGEKKRNDKRDIACVRVTGCGAGRGEGARKAREAIGYGRGKRQRKGSKFFIGKNSIRERETWTCVCYWSSSGETEKWDLSRSPSFSLAFSVSSAQSGPLISETASLSLSTFLFSLPLSPDLSLVLYPFLPSSLTRLLFPHSRTFTPTLRPSLYLSICLSIYLFSYTFLTSDGSQLRLRKYVIIKRCVSSCIQGILHQMNSLYLKIRFRFLFLRQHCLEKYKQYLY